MRTIVYIGADFCPTCKFLHPQVEKYCAENDIEFKYVDAEAEANLVAYYGVRNLPTIILEEDGEITMRETNIDGWNKIKDIL